MSRAKGLLEGALSMLEERREINREGLLEVLREVCGLLIEQGEGEVACQCCGRPLGAILCPDCALADDSRGEGELEAALRQVAERAKLRRENSDRLIRSGDGENLSAANADLLLAQGEERAVDLIRTALHGGSTDR